VGLDTIQVALVSSRGYKSGPVRGVGMTSGKSVKVGLEAAGAIGSRNAHINPDHAVCLRGAG
jgi:hypothetical protein